MSEHRDDSAATADDKHEEESPADRALESGHPTGEEQAAVNREIDPPA